MKPAPSPPTSSPVDRLLAERGGVAAPPVRARVPAPRTPAATAPVVSESPSTPREWLTVLALGLVPVALGLALSGLLASGHVDADESLAFGLILAWTAAGISLAVRRPLCHLGVLLLAGTATAGLAFACSSAATDRGWTGEASQMAELVGAAATFSVAAVGLHALLALPAGLLGTSGRRAVAAVGYGSAIALGLWAASSEDGATAPLVAAAWVVALAAGLPGAHTRYLSSTGTERQRLQWVGCGATLALEAAIVIGALDILIDWPANAPVAAGWFTVLIPASVGAGASPRLAPRVDHVLVHIVSVAGLTAVTLATYIVVVLGLGDGRDDPDRLLGLSMLAAAIAALLYIPARDRLGQLANRLVYGERHAPDEVLRTFGARLTRALPLEELLLQLAESLHKTLALSRAEVWTGSPDLLELSVSVPFAPPRKLVVGEKERGVVARAGVSGPAWVAVWLPSLLRGREQATVRVTPITHSGELLGLIVVERPPDGDQFDEEADTMLAELARQVGLALHNVNLDTALQATLDEVRRTNEELRASRARIVASGDAERRKIERNLHDGAQQHLVALAVNLRLVKDIVAEDQALAVEMLDELDGAVKDTIAELRSLAHGIYPPLLVDAGLGDALRAAAGRSPCSVDVEAEDLGRYPAEVEAAIYFCCLEALQNAGKHAPDAGVTVRVWEEAGGLLFEVVDDGPGFDPGAHRDGQGFTNMNDRLGAIGGSVRWISAPGQGTRVAGSVPLA